MIKKIKVLAIPGDHYGCGLHRGLNPHLKLDELYNDEFDVTIDYKPDFSNYSFFEKFDIIHAHRFLGNYQTNANLLQFLKEKNIKLVLDIDDHWRLNEFHPAYLRHQRLGLPKIAQDSLKNANYVTTTTEIFANKIRKINPNVVVLPNAIDPDDIKELVKNNPSKRLRVGMIMGSSHLHDVEELRGMVSSLPKEIMEQIQIVLCGFDTTGNIETIDQKTGQVTKRPMDPKETVWYTYERILTNDYQIVSPEYREFLHQFVPNSEYPNVENEPYRRCWTLPANRYISHYSNVDVLIVPLRENEFTESKSELKLVEAGFTDTAVIAQDFGPYTINTLNMFEKGGIIRPDGNVILIDSRRNHKDWAKYITKLVKHPELLTLLKTNLREMVNKKYNLKDITAKRAEFYKSIVST